MIWYYDTENGCVKLLFAIDPLTDEVLGLIFYS